MTLTMIVTFGEGRQIETPLHHVNMRGRRYEEEGYRALGKHNHYILSLMNATTESFPIHISSDWKQHVTVKQTYIVKRLDSTSICLPSHVLGLAASLVVWIRSARILSFVVLRIQQFILEDDKGRSADHS